jgi:hypothetical protein
MYIKVDSNGNPEGFPITWENVQYLVDPADRNAIVTPEMLDAYSLKLIENYNAPPGDEDHNMDSFNIIRGEIIKTANGDIEQQWIISEIPLKEKIRRWVSGPRMSYLLRTDWTQVADAPLTPEERAEWTEYRAKLRSITDDIDFNTIKRREDIDWPTMPGVLDTADSKWADIPEAPPQP